MKSLRTDATVPLRLLIDLAITAATFCLAYYLAARHGFPRELAAGSPPIDGYVAALVVVLAAFVWASVSHQLYRARRAGSYFELAIDVTRVHLHVALTVFAVAFFFRQYSYSRVIAATFFALNPILCLAHHGLSMVYERARFRRGRGLRKALVIGVGPLARDFTERVRHHPWTGLSIVGFLDPGSDAADGADTAAPSIDASQILGGLDQLEQIVEANDIEEILVTLPFRELGLIADVDARLTRTARGLRVILDLQALNTLSREIAEFDGTPVINLRGVRTYGFHAVAKRALDIAIAGPALVGLSPVLAIIALVVKCTDGGPVLFKQERVGLDNRRFKMLKFRSMRMDAESQGPVFADDNDPRCTKFGLWLRRSSVDELPQLWNILVGEMSLVGPRPERPHFIEEFRRTVPRYMMRHRMKAGLTGWAQINGWRGKSSLDRRIEFDLYYLSHWSLWFDLKILLLTLVRAWKPPALPAGPVSGSNRSRATGP